ncbi:unnamed protein product [Caenorhabditis brenneri]
MILHSENGKLKKINTVNVLNQELTVGGHFQHQPNGIQQPPVDRIRHYFVKFSSTWQNNCRVCKNCTRKLHVHYDFLFDPQAKQNQKYRRQITS